MASRLLPPVRTVQAQLQERKATAKSQSKGKHFTAASAQVIHHFPFCRFKCGTIAVTARYTNKCKRIYKYDKGSVTLFQIGSLMSMTIAPIRLSALFGTSITTPLSAGFPSYGMAKPSGWCEPTTKCKCGVGCISEERMEYPMQAVYNPLFLNARLTPQNWQTTSYGFKREHERVIYDPYAFRSPRLTEFDLHLFAGNHHRIYEVRARTTELS